MPLKGIIQLHNNSSLKYAQTAVVIVAAGRGHRAGGGMPKQYRDLGGEMVLRKTLECFLAGQEGFGTIAVVIHPDDLELYAQAVSGLDTNIVSVHGGATRTASVKAGLMALANTETRGRTGAPLFD